jgi:hypothetical protein
MLLVTSVGQLSTTTAEMPMIEVVGLRIIRKQSEVASRQRHDARWSRSDPLWILPCLGLMTGECANSKLEQPGLSRILLTEKRRQYSKEIAKSTPRNRQLFLSLWPLAVSRISA